MRKERAARTCTYVVGLLRRVRDEVAVREELAEVRGMVEHPAVVRQRDAVDHGVDLATDLMAEGRYQHLSAQKRASKYQAERGVAGRCYTARPRSSHPRRGVAPACYAAPTSSSHRPLTRCSRKVLRRATAVLPLPRRGAAGRCYTARPRSSRTPRRGLAPSCYTAPTSSSSSPDAV